MPIVFDTGRAAADRAALETCMKAAEVAHGDLFARRCAGGDFLGWLDLPDMGEAAIVDIERAAADIKSRCDCLVVIGIGGSYMGARSAIDFIRSPLYNQLSKATPDVYFAGTALGGDALHALLSICEDREVCVNLVSKSGTTTETAVAFRSFEDMLCTRYGDEAGNRIVCTCGDGPLGDYADRKGYRRFAVPEDVGGRYSVLSAVGLLPMAVAGIDIREVLSGARRAKEAYFSSGALSLPGQYAAYRHAMNRPVELLALSGAELQSFGYWLQQLIAESEGKAGRGVLPVPSVYTTDLHSLGQFVQQGPPVLFETMIEVEQGQSGAVVAPGDDFDKLSPLAGQSLDRLNALAMRAVAAAHTEGGVPVLSIRTHRRDAFHYGALVFFFEVAAAISSLIVGVNPFDQPGVEDYKTHMRELFRQLTD